MSKSVNAGEAMEAGRERGEALVVELAERVMGWTLSEHETGGTLNRRLYPVWRDAQGRIVAYFSEWAPLADIADAFQVVRAMERKGWRVGMTNESGRWNVWFGYIEGEAKPGVATDIDPAPAICRAALAALSPSTGGKG